METVTINVLEMEKVQSPRKFAIELFEDIEASIKKLTDSDVQQKDLKTKLTAALTIKSKIYSGHIKVEEARQNNVGKYIRFTDITGVPGCNRDWFLSLAADNLLEFKFGQLKN